MKIVGALFLALLVVQYSSANPTGEEKAILFEKEFEKVLNTCAEKNKLPADELQQYKNKELPESPAAKCFVACLMEQMGVIKHGEIDQDVIDSILEQELGGKDDKIAMAKEESRKCRSEIDQQKIADNCEKAFAIKKCFMKNMH